MATFLVYLVCFRFETDINNIIEITIAIAATSWDIASVSGITYRIYLVSRIPSRMSLHEEYQKTYPQKTCPSAVFLFRNMQSSTTPTRLRSDSYKNSGCTGGAEFMLIPSIKSVLLPKTSQFTKLPHLPID